MEHEIANKNEQLIQNIKLLEQGISLNEYLKRKEEIKIKRGDLGIEYGVVVLLDETRKLCRLGFYEQDVETYILDRNSKIYRHYQKDDIILKFHKCDNEEEFQNILKYYSSKYQDLNSYHFDREKIYWKNMHRQKCQKSTSRKLRSIGVPLLQLKSKSSFLYELLNAIADLLVKPIPIFICLMISNRGQIFVGLNVIQKLLFGGVFITAMYVGSVLIYLFLFIVIRIVMLICFRERLEVKFKIFDTIIDLTELSWRDFE